jgi:hypothetical protein
VSPHAGRSPDSRQAGRAPQPESEVSDLKIGVGPGYRVYHSQRPDRLLPLPAGGARSTQAKDVAGALELDQRKKDCGVEVVKKVAAKKSVKTTPYDGAVHLRTPEEMAAYLDAWLEQAPDDAA